MAVLFQEQRGLAESTMPQAETMQDLYSKLDITPNTPAKKHMMRSAIEALASRVGESGSNELQADFSAKLREVFERVPLVDIQMAALNALIRIGDSNRETVALLKKIAKDGDYKLMREAADVALLMLNCEGKAAS